MTSISTPKWPDRIISDLATPEALVQALGSSKAERVFVIISRTLARESGVVTRIQALLGDRFAGHFVGIPAHSPQPSVLEAADAARRGGADLLVSIGGGSISDATKVVQVCLTYDLRDLASLATWRKTRKTAPKLPMVPHISVPTTLSAAELTAFAGARNPETGLKDAFGDPGLLPKAIVFDAALTIHTPSELWLSSGLRAIDHAIEALCSPQRHLLSDTLVQQGFLMLLDGLRQTNASPEDLKARAASQFGMVFAAAGLMSGVPMGISHAIGHVLGGLFDVPHGFTSCVMLPAALKFNQDTIADRLALLAPALGCSRSADVPEALRAYIGALGLPTSLSQVGVDASKFPDIAVGTLKDPWAATNPKPIRGEGDVLQILNLAA